MPPRERTTTSRTCGRCGRREACVSGGAPVGWTISVDAGRTGFLCVRCSRDNIRAIEGKLPEEYWE
jgi:hypothetical protein